MKRQSIAQTISPFALLLAIILHSAGAFALPSTETVTTLSGVPDDMEIDAARGVIYVSVPDANQIQVVSMDTLQVVDSIDFTGNPRGLDLSDDGATLFVALAGTGTVGFVNPDTKAVSEVSVATEIGTTGTYDVIHTSVNRVFVSGNSTGFAALGVIKLGQSNAVQRVAGSRYIRGKPVFAQVPGDPFLYVQEGGSPSPLYKIDLLEDAHPIVLEGDAKSWGNTPRTFSISPDGQLLFTRSAQVFRTSNFIQKAEPDQRGAGDLSSDGSEYYVIARQEVRAFSTKTFLQTGGQSAVCAALSGIARRLTVVPGDSGWIVLEPGFSGSSALCYAPKSGGFYDGFPVDPNGTLGGEGFDFEFDEVRNRVYVSVPERNEVVILSWPILQVIDRVWVGTHPHGLDISLDGSRLFVALNRGGAIAVVDLDTLGLSEIIVGETLGHAYVFDVSEAKPDRLFVSANPGSSGFGYVALVKLDQHNTQSRVADNRIIRSDPVLLPSPNQNHLFVLARDALYKLDIASDDAPIVLIDPPGLVYKRDRMVLSPDGEYVLLDNGKVLASSNFLQVAKINAGQPALSPDSSAFSMLKSGQPIRLTLFDRLNFNQLGSGSGTCSFQDVSKYAPVPGTNGWLVLGDDGICFTELAFDPQEYYPVADGASWLYMQNNSSYYTVDVLDALTEINGVQTHALNFSSGYIQYVTADRRGVWLHREENPSFQATYDPPLPLTPATMTVGKIRSKGGTVTIVESGLPPQQFEYNTTVRIIARSDVTVPYATLPAFEIRQDLEFLFQGVPFGSSTQTVWLARNVGPIKVQETVNDTLFTEELAAVNFPVPGIDDDGDGLTNDVDSDDDNDGMLDSFELTHHFDPLDATDAFQDADGDGFSNMAEAMLGSHPRDEFSTPMWTFSDTSPSQRRGVYAQIMTDLGIVLGCETNKLCPHDIVKRALASVWLGRASHGAAYTPPEPTDSVYGDVPRGAFGAAWIGQAQFDGTVDTCVDGLFCPTQAVTRRTLAKWLLLAKYGNAFTPDAAIGVLFEDVPVEGQNSAWLEEAWWQGFIDECAPYLMCPDSVVTRIELLEWIGRAFDHVTIF